MSPAEGRALRAPRAFVFDLDGTLVDSRRDIVEACNYTLATLGRGALDDATIIGFVGDGSRMLLSRLLKADPASETVESAHRIFSAFYAEHAAASTTWMPGAREALDALRPLPLTLVTNKPRAATVTLLSALDATSRFASIVAGGDGPLKPNPEAIRAALAPTGVAPEHAWVVGDGVQDVEAGRAAHCTTVAVLGGFASEERLRAAGPDALLASIVELVPLARGAHAKPM
jgi:phosphoglycolate phosphatase